MTTTTTASINLHTHERRPGVHLRAMTGIIIAAVLLVIGLLVPVAIPQSYWMSVLVDSALVAIVAVSIGFLYRHLGLISLGQTAFYGGSAYVTAILNVKLGWGFMPAALAGIFAGIVLAVIIGLLVMRAKGIAFLMLTMALGLSVYQLVLMDWARPVTGTYDGLILMPQPDDHFLWLSNRDIMNDSAFWPLAWGVLIVVVLALWLAGRSRFGTVLHGIRENEERMRFSGFDTLMPRFVAFVIAGTVASIAGVLTVMNSGLVTDQMLGFQTAGNQLVVTIVGGMATVLGPIVGAFLFTYLQSAFSSAGGMQFFLGATLVVVLAFMRGGIVGAIELLIRDFSRRMRSMRGKGK